MSSRYSIISFPGLGLEINPPQSFVVGPFTIHIYGILIALALVAAVLYACRRCSQFGIREDDILDGVLWVTPLAIVGARLYYVAFQWEQYKDNLISILYIWEGGIAIYGAVIGAVIGVVILCLVKKLKLPALLDLVALGFLLGQAIGRWGNFFNREAFGAETDTFLRMGLLDSWSGIISYVHPTFLYESVWNILGFVLLHKISKKRQYDGQIALGYVAWYGLGRTFIEGLRADSLYWGNFRVSQILAAVSCLAAAAVLLWQLFKAHDPEKLLVNQVAKLEAEKKAQKEAGEEASEADSGEPEDKAEQTPEEETAGETEETAQEAPSEEAAEEAGEAEEETPEEAE